MIKDLQFEVNDPNPNPGDKWVGGFAINTNIGKRLQKLKDLNFRKWKIILSDGQTENTHVHWEHGNDLEITLYLDFNKIENCKEEKNIRLLYELIFQGLAVIWNVKGWDVDQLNQIHQEIIHEDYKVFVIVGKDHPSPDKNYKAQLYCELFPDYADYYVRFLSKGNKEYKSIKFLKGPLNPHMFFGVFNNFYWPDAENFIIGDFYKEIFIIFNISSNSFSTEFKPGDYTVEELKNYLQSFDHNIPKETRSKFKRFKR